MEAALFTTMGELGSLGDMVPTLFRLGLTGDFGTASFVVVVVVGTCDDLGDNWSGLLKARGEQMARK